MTPIFHPVFGGIFCGRIQPQMYPNNSRKEFQLEKMDEATYNANVNAIDRLLSSSAISYLLVAANKPVGVGQV